MRQYIQWCEFSWFGHEGEPRKLMAPQSCFCPSYIALGTEETNQVEPSDSNMMHPFFIWRPQLFSSWFKRKTKAQPLNAQKVRLSFNFAFLALLTNECNSIWEERPRIPLLRGISHHGYSTLQVYQNENTHLPKSVPCVILNLYLIDS